MENEIEVVKGLESKIEEEKVFKTEVVTEVDSLLVDGLISQFDNQCDVLQENIREFANVVEQRSNLIEDIASSNVQSLISQLREENEDLKIIRGNLENLIIKLKKFNLQLKPLEPGLVPKSETTYGTFPPKIKTVEKKVAKVHNTYYKVCTALGLESNTLEAMQIYTEMPEHLRALIGSQSVEQAEEKVNKLENTSGLKKSPSMTNLGPIPLFDEEKSDAELKKILGLENISDAEWQELVSEQELALKLSREASLMSSPATLSTQEEKKETEEKKLNVIENDENVVEKALSRLGKSNG